MKPADRIIDSAHDARGAVVVILLVSLARLALERGLLSDATGAARLPPLNLMMPLGNALFYCACFWLWSALFSGLLARPHTRVANAICVGLVFGLLPPLIDLFTPGDHRMPFRWFKEVTWTLFADEQPRAESITLWLLVAGTAGWVYYYTRSAGRALLGLVGAYLFCHLITVVVLRTQGLGRPGLGLLAISLVTWFTLRARTLARCLGRLNHGLPHGALALAGAAWVGQPLAIGIERALVMVFGVFVLLVHNDHYDRREDQAAGRAPSSTADDVVWTTVFYVLLLLCYALNQPMLALIGFSFLLFGFLYHHPALRLKERFCLSYLVEGAWALLAFLAGAAAGSDFPPGARLAVTATAVFGGGALLSMPKDWKDVAADRSARIPTIYVLLSGRGYSERTVHRLVVAAVTLGLLLPPMWLLIRVVARPGAVAPLLVGALVPGALLLGIAARRRAVEGMLWALTGYLVLLGAVAREAAPNRARPGLAPVASISTNPEPGVPTAHIVAQVLPDEALRALFAPDGIEAMTDEPLDFGRIRHGRSPGPHYAVTPRSPSALIDVVARAYANGVPMRLRGQGHSMNGSTLPGPGELTIRTRALRTLRFEKPGTVTAQAGVPIRDLTRLLRERLGYDLPVYNGGRAEGGPSIGGFINAGGFGDGSAQHGGFWENVDAVTLVVAGGRTVTLERTDPDFPWLFGAMGQLGVVLEARLDLVPLDAAHPPAYPMGRSMAVDTPPTEATSITPLYWYTLFVSPTEKDAAARALAEIQDRHAGEMAYRPPYTYPIRHRRLAAPLVYPPRGGRGEDFFAIGIWGDGPSTASVEGIEREVAALVRTAGYRRYVQAEVVAGSDAYRDYFGDATYRELQRRRQAVDPAGLFNRGTVFEE